MQHLDPNERPDGLIETSVAENVLGSDLQSRLAGSNHQPPEIRMPNYE